MKYRVTFTNKSCIEFNIKVDARDEDDAKWQAWIKLESEWDLSFDISDIKRVRQVK